jgi:hypothetical protein
MFFANGLIINVDKWVQWFMVIFTVIIFLLTSGSFYLSFNPKWSIIGYPLLFILALISLFFVYWLGQFFHGYAKRADKVSYVLFITGMAISGSFSTLPGDPAIWPLQNSIGIFGLALIAAAGFLYFKCGNR